MISYSYSLSQNSFKRYNDTFMVITDTLIFGIKVTNHYLNLNRSEEHTSELQSRFDLVCRLLLEFIHNIYLIYHIIKYVFFYYEPSLHVAFCLPFFYSIPPHPIHLFFSYTTLFRSNLDNDFIFLLFIAKQF